MSNPNAVSQRPAPTTGPTGVFYQLRPDTTWMFVWASATIGFDVEKFNEENPDGKLIFVNPERMWSGDGQDIALHTVPLDDGRLVDVFPGTGGVQVYTADRRHGYELKLPTPEQVTRQAKSLGTPSGSALELKLIG